MRFKFNSPKSYNESIEIRDKYDCMSLIKDTMRKLCEDEQALTNIVDADPFYIEERGLDDGPMFITRSGKWISVVDSLKEYDDGYTTHQDLLKDVIEKIFYLQLRPELGIDENLSLEEWLAEYDCHDYDTIISLDQFTTWSGWARANMGNTWVEDRLYFVLPYNATIHQMYAIQDALEGVGYGTEYQAFFLDSDGWSTWHVKYNIDEVPADKFFKIMRRYISTGKRPLGEGLNKRIKRRLKEVYEEPPYDYGTGVVRGKDIFDRKTHVPFYDNLLSNPQYMAEKENLKGEIVMMSPNEYYEECATKIFQNTTAERLKEERRWSKDNLDYLTKLVTKYKRRMFMPYINYAEKGQEGLHRMMVAGDLFGWDEEFPVLVITSYDEERRIKREKEKEENFIIRLFSRMVDRYRYPHYCEEDFEEEIRDYLSENYDSTDFEYYDPFSFTMWYRTDDREYSGYDACLVFELNDGLEIEINAEGIEFGYEDEEDNDIVDEIDWSNPYWDKVDLSNPHLDIDEILKGYKESQ